MGFWSPPSLPPVIGGKAVPEKALAR